MTKISTILAASAMAAAFIGAVEASEYTNVTESTMHENLLTRNLREDGVTDFIVTFHDPEDHLALPDEQQILNLHTRSEQAQKGIVDTLEQLDAHHTGYDSYKGSNQLLVKSGSGELLRLVKKDPSVKSVSAITGFNLQQCKSRQKGSACYQSGSGFTTVNINKANRVNSWGITNINAPWVWDKNYTGSGTVLGSIDSGVRVNHEAIYNQYIGLTWGNWEAWLDAVGERLKTKKDTPFDDLGHGTHVVGTMVGRFGIGVAPDASWMACRACAKVTSGDECQSSDLIRCLNWMQCPNGNQATCGARRPQIVANSWGSPNSDTTLNPAIDKLQGSQIFVLFSAGNTGRECGTIMYPGSYKNAVAVGALNTDGTLAPLSSKGPSPFGYTKPDFVAPGVNIISAHISSDTAYASTSGTSMAAPHIAGALALIRSKYPASTGWDAWGKLMTCIRPSVTVPAAATPVTLSRCTTRPSGTTQNDYFGSGRLDFTYKPPNQQWETMA